MSEALIPKFDDSRLGYNFGGDITSSLVLPSGILDVRVSVDDVSDFSATRAGMQEEIAHYDRLLASNRNWREPKKNTDTGFLLLDPNNLASEWIYKNPGMRRWHELHIPTAKALLPMQRPDLELLPDDDIPIDPITKSFFIDALDSIGIRSRAKIMKAIAIQAIQPQGDARWYSLACGAGIPVFDALTSLKRNVGAAAHITMVDMDTSVLQFAKGIAEHDGLRQGQDFTLVTENLIGGLGLLGGRSPLIDRLGGVRTADMVDALGIFEYFRASAATRFLKKSYELVRPGGSLVAANMRLDRDELAFNMRGIGWPEIFPRSTEELTELVVNAGINPRNVTFITPEDGIYTVMKIDQPEDSFDGLRVA